MNKEQFLYVHIPFCQKLCDYCDFTKLQYFRKFAIIYLDSLEKELKSYSVNKPVTIYVGGGTPTALEDDLFERLLKILSLYQDKDITKEYTFEANPESLSENKIKLLKKYNVNRISLGVQSTDERILKAINREHSFSDVKKAISLLKENGIDNVNVDLILGLPHSSKSLLLKDLENIVMLDIKHVSCYALTIHPHTVLYNQGYKELEGDEMRELYDIVENYLKDKGFNHYEISNWAKDGYESLHNLNYWRNGEYFGVGLGAAGYLNNVRYKNTINLDKYLKGEYVEEKEELTNKDKLTYQIMLNLRTYEGLDLIYLKEQFSYDLSKKMKEEINSLINEGDIVLDPNNKIICTYKGMMILDTIILKLLP